MCIYRYHYFTRTKKTCHCLKKFNIGTLIFVIKNEGVGVVVVLNVLITNEESKG